jgi:peptide/nickel transport system permease protein
MAVLATEPETAAARPRVSAPHPVRSLLVRRVPLGALSVVLVALMTYLATAVLPGNAATAILGQHATPRAVALLRRQLGLNQSALAGFLHWAGNFLTGNFGASLTEGRGSVTSLVIPHLVNSVVLMVVVAVVSTIGGIVIGVLSAYRRDSRFDDITSVITLVASALPEFVVGVLVVFIFSVGLVHWFPAVSILPPSQRIWDQPVKLVLPALTLVIVCTPYIARMVRAAMIEALNSDFAEVAVLKGSSVPRLLFRHALPNAIAPSVQVVGLTVLYLAGGIVLVETVFQYPGIGLTLVDAIEARDVTVLQFIVVLLAAFYVSLNILTDTVVLLATPRRRAPR